MTVAYRSHSFPQQGEGVTADPVQLAKPAGTVAGDVLLAYIFVAQVGLFPVITLPSGWTLLQEIEQEDYGVSLFKKVAGGSEPASYLFELNTECIAGGVMVAYSGAVDVNVAGTFGQNAASTNRVAPAISPSVVNSTLIAFFFLSSWGFPSTPPAGMTERLDSGTGGSGYGGDGSIMVCDQQLAATGTTGTRTATGSAADSWNILVALTPTTALVGDSLFFGGDF